MFKRLYFLIIIILLGCSFLIGKNFILKVVLGQSVRAISGLKCSIDRIDIGLVKTFIDVRNLTLLNPEGFSDDIMFEIPRLYIEYDLRSLFRDKVHIKDMAFELGALNVIKNDKGELNLNSLNVIKPISIIRKERKAAKEPMPGVTIDRLHLKVAKVTYKDYTKIPTAKVTEFEIDLDEYYENIQDPYALGCLIVSKSLYKTTVSRLTGFDLGPLEERLEGIMAKGALGFVSETSKKALGISKEFREVAGKAFKETKDVLKEVIKFPFREEENR